MIGNRLASRVTALVATLMLAGCERASSTWTGWAYPSRDDLTLSVSLTGFDTFEQCQEATIHLLRSFEHPDAGSFVCGQRCRWDPTLKTNVCKVLKR